MLFLLLASLTFLTENFSRCMFTSWICEALVLKDKIDQYGMGRREKPAYSGFWRFKYLLHIHKNCLMYSTTYCTPVAHRSTIQGRLISFITDPLLFVVMTSWHRVRLEELTAYHKAWVEHGKWMDFFKKVPFLKKEIWWTTFATIGKSSKGFLIRYSITKGWWGSSSLTHNSDSPLGQTHMEGNEAHTAESVYNGVNRRPYKYLKSSWHMNAIYN